MRTSIIHYLVAILATAMLALAGCQPRDGATPPPAETDTLAADDTVMTPLGTPEPTGEAAVRVAVARLQPVADADVSGQVRFEETGRGVIVIAEVGGLAAGTHDLRILEQAGCTDLDDSRPFNPTGVGDSRRPHGSLDAIEVTDDGTGRYETLHPDLRLAGPHSVLGRAVVAIEAGHHHAAHPEDRVVACGVIGPAVD